MFVVDIETDGLISTKIHVVSTMDVDTGVIKSYTDYNEMKEFFSSAKILIGHNIIRFDVPAIENVLGIEVNAKLVDTLALSWYLEFDRRRHGLEGWGEDLGVSKPEIADWKTLQLREYVHRCEEDVKINKLLWDRLWVKLLKLYDTEEQAWHLIKYLSFKMDCAAEQERSKWKLDVDKATKGLQTLEEDKESKVEQLKQAMPSVPVITKKKRPKKPFKQDGSHSSVGEKWFTLLGERSLPEDYSGVVEVVTKYEDPKPTSSPQIKDWLYSFGWKPETFKYVRNKDTGDIRKIPQVNLEKGGGICPSVKKLYSKEPNLEVLEGLSVLTHRIAILKGFLSSVDDDGWIKAEIQGLTNTMRFKHAVVVNLPGVKSAYGELIRGCLSSPEGFELCGSDMSSLEDRIKQHYLWPFDKKYVRTMMSDGYDPHLTLAVSAGAITEQEMEDHKNGVKDFSEIRSIYKATNYACQYGAGGPTIARSANVPVKKGKELHEAYWALNWAIRAVPKTIQVKKEFGTMWLLNPISHLWYQLREEKDIFSTLVQGTGVYCFDTWIACIRSKRPQLTGQMHDEIILTIKEGNREECTKLLRWAIKQTNRKLKLNRDLDVDIQYGNNYSEIH